MNDSQKFNFGVLLGILTVVFSPLGLPAQDSSEDWVGHWINGLELAKDQKSYPKATELYSTAINALGTDQTLVQFNLILERGELYYQMLDYPNAIKDFSSVIQNPKVQQDQLIEALWGRSKAYLASGQVKNYEKDAAQLAGFEFLFEPVAETKEYTVLKVNSERLHDPKTRELFIKLLMKRKQIVSEKDVTFTPSGWIIIKKAKQQG